MCDTPSVSVHQAQNELRIGVALLGGLAEPGHCLPVILRDATAEQGNADAQFILGLMYANGRGTAQDIVRAYAWWTVSAAAGHELAIKMQENAAEYLTAEELFRAHSIAAELGERFR